MADGDASHRGSPAVRYTHVAVGNLNVDMYLYVDRLPSPDDVIVVEEALIWIGGAAANYAVAVARAGHKSKLVAHTTKHMEALGFLGALKAEGVDTTTVRVHGEGMPGLVTVFVLPTGSISMVKLKGVNRMLTGDEVAKALPADAVHFASVEPSVLLKAYEASKGFPSAKIVSYDPGGAVVEKKAREVVEAAREAATILSVNARELELITGSRDYRSAFKLLDGRLKVVLVRIGGGGAYLVTDDGVLQVYGYHHGTPVDTTGAGDTFNAYFNAYLLEHEDYQVALAAASIAAGIKVTRRGAQSAPRREEVEPKLRELAWRLVRRLE